MNLIILGAPGAGKGTQCGRISAKWNIPSVSTGDIFRKNIKEQTKLGVLAKNFIEKGQLVPDEAVIDIVKERLAEEDCKYGFVLDGFPRTKSQAEELSRFVNIDKVINLNIELELLSARLTGRRMCSKCGEIYNISFLTSCVCSKCGGGLTQRDDDNEEIIKERLRVYLEQTKPLIDFYKQTGLLINIQTDVSAEIVFERICSILE